MSRRKVEDSATVEAGPESFRVRHAIRHALRVDVRFNSGWEGIRQAARIEDGCKLLELPGNPVLVDEGDWEKLCDALRSPSPLNGMAPYPLSPALSCVPLITLVLEAKREDP